MGSYISKRHRFKEVKKPKERSIAATNKLAYSVLKEHAIIVTESKVVPIYFRDLTKEGFKKLIDLGIVMLDDYDSDLNSPDNQTFYKQENVVYSGYFRKSLLNSGYKVIITDSY